MNVNFPSNSSQKVVGLWGDDTPMSEEGGFFTTTNPTVGTGIAQTICVDDAATASSTHAQFAPALVLYNNDSPSNTNAVSIYPRYIRILCTAAPASATMWQYALRLDNVNRYSSGGSVLVPVNPNPNSSKASKSLIYFGAVIPTALPSATSRLVAHGQLDSAIPVVGDQYAIMFGASSATNDMLSGGTVAKNATMSAPPVVVPPGWSLSLEMWGTSNAATPASWELEMGHVERIPGL